jgi:hypothetical protein
MEAASTAAVRFTPLDTEAAATTAELAMIETARRRVMLNTTLATEAAAACAVRLRPPETPADAIAPDTADTAADLPLMDRETPSTDDTADAAALRALVALAIALAEDEPPTAAARPRASERADVAMDAASTAADRG